MVVNNIQDKLEGDELDLSMMSLKEVPLKEIASVTRATTLDLSSNVIRHLPPNFGILVNLIKLDISSNKLQALPKTFYLLVNLKHLDLYNNQLTDLPVSLHHLTKLRFLDIKNNPLTPELRSVVGDCITRKECEAAAKKLIAYFTKEKQLALEQEVMANKMKEQREQNHREEVEAARLRNEKKAAKKERKNENKHQKQHERQQQQLSEQQQHSSATQANAKTNGNAAKTQRVPSKGSRSSSGGSWCSCLGWVNLMLCVVITMSAGYCLHLHIEGDYSAAGLQEALPRLQQSALRLQNMTVEALQPDNLRKTGYLVLRHANTSAYQAAEATQRAAYAAQEYIEVYTGDLTPYTSKVSSWCSVACTWTKRQTLIGYEWLIAQDWQGMWDAFFSVCMQVWSKIQAAWASAMANPSVKAAWDAVCHQCCVAAAWMQSCALVVIKYMQDNGPLWLQWLQDSVNTAVTAVRNSVQSLIK